MPLVVRFVDEARGDDTAVFRSELKGYTRVRDVVEYLVKQEIDSFYLDDDEDGDDEMRDMKRILDEIVTAVRSSKADPTNIKKAKRAYALWEEYRSESNRGNTDDVFVVSDSGYAD